MELPAMLRQLICKKLTSKWSENKYLMKSFYASRINKKDFKKVNVHEKNWLRPKFECAKFARKMLTENYIDGWFKLNCERDLIRELFKTNLEEPQRQFDTTQRASFLELLPFLN